MMMIEAEKNKYYYAGSERIASKIGGGGIDSLYSPIVNIDNKRSIWEEYWSAIWGHCLNFLPTCTTFFYNLAAEQTVHQPETDLYFYHPDHLGSSSWITDISGTAIQHLQYLPFGESRVDQRTTSWNSRYSFSAKEKDEESGYGYFGARYYDSDLSIWLSVDPMAGKYPHLSPYAYVANNPVKLVDPNGEEIENSIDELGSDIKPPTKNDPNKPNSQTNPYTSEPVEIRASKPASSNSGKAGASKKESSEKPQSKFKAFFKLIDEGGHSDGANTGRSSSEIENKITDAIEPVAKGLVLLIPLASLANSGITLATGSDIYNNEATATDYGLSVIGIATFGASNFLQLPKAAATAVKWTGRATTMGSVYTTIKNEKEKEK